MSIDYQTLRLLAVLIYVFMHTQCESENPPPEVIWHFFHFLGDRTNGRAIGTVLRLSSSYVVCL